MVRWTQPGRAWQDWDAPWEPLEPLTDTPENRAAFAERVRRRTAPGSVRTRLEIEAPVTAPGEGSGRATPRHLGWVSRYWVDEASGWLEVGINICEEEEWGRGYGREALELWIDYLFRELPLRRLGTATWSGNTRMVSLAYRLGMAPEARVRQARVVRGKVYDAVRFGVLREEWQARRDPATLEVLEAGTVVVRRSGAAPGGSAGAEPGCHPGAEPGPSDPLILVVWSVGHGDPSLPKGHILPGEAAEEAALRETFEETGYRVQLMDHPPVTVTGVAVRHQPWLRRRITFYLARPAGQSPSAKLVSRAFEAGLRAEPIAASGWLPLSEARLAFRLPEHLAALTAFFR